MYSQKFSCNWDENEALLSMRNHWLHFISTQDKIFETDHWYNIDNILVIHPKDVKICQRENINIYMKLLVYLKSPLNTLFLPQMLEVNKCDTKRNIYPRWQAGMKLLIFFPDKKSPSFFTLP